MNFQTSKRIRNIQHFVHFLQGLSGKVCSIPRACLVHVPNFGGLSGSEDRGGGDNSIQFINFGRMGDKSFK